MNISMGIGKLGDPNTIFSRKYRWILEGTNLPSSFAKDVKFDFVAKTIKFNYYDVISDGKGMHALVWADQLKPSEILIFKALDGLGNELYQLEFSNLNIIEHTSNFDYEDSDIATTELTIKYATIHKKLIACQDKFDKYNWKLKIDDVEIPVIVGRPDLSIEETEINHLNEKFFLPGQAKWEELKVIADTEEIRKSINKFIDGKKTNCELRTYKNETLIETWSFNSWCKNFQMGDCSTELVLSVEQVKFTT